MRKMNKKCHTNGPYKEYSDEQLLEAFKEVKSRVPWKLMSEQTYDEFKTETEPCFQTIKGRFGSWTEARRLALNG